MNDEELERNISNERDLLSYLNLLEKSLLRYVIIIAVCDTGAAEYFTQRCAEAMMKMGLKINMFGRFRQPYIAIIDQGNVLIEKSSEDLTCPIIVNGKLNHHDIVVYSAGYCYQHGVGSGAIMLIDGANYMHGGRGFNFLIYDKKKDVIVDSCSFDTYAFGKCNRSFNPYESALVFLGKRMKENDVQLCILQLPRFPNKNNLDASEYERWQANNRAKMDECFTKKYMIKDYMKTIFENKMFPFCDDYDSFEDFYDAFNEPMSFVNLDGSIRHSDYKSHAVNILNGIRVTTNQPKTAKRSIFFVGPSYFYGWGATDSNTIESLLQKLLNQSAPEQEFVVYNYSYGGKIVERDFSTLRSLPLKRGDIVVVYSRVSIWGLPNCDLSLKSVRPHSYGEIFTDVHYTHNGNRLIADGIFDFLKKHDFFVKSLSSDVGSPVCIQSNSVEDGELQDYKTKLKMFYKQKIGPRVGAIVMNCNPFTFGHLYLVECSLQHCDFLIVFVVQEDKSDFPFVDRIELAKKV